MSVALAPHLLAVALGMTHPGAVDPLGWRTLPNGMTIRYFEQGEPTGTPVILIHGFTDSWQTWSRILPRFPEHYHLIAIDMRGHGGSDRPPSGYGVPELAEDVAGLMSVLDLDDAIVIGHSLGSFVAREVVRRTPRRVSRLILVGSGASAHNDGMHQLRDLIHSFGDEIPSDFIEEFQRSTFSRPLPDDFLAGVMAASAVVPPRVWREGIDGLIAFDDRRRLGQLRLPTLLIWGEEDQVFARTDQEALLDAIPGARLVSYRGIGHAPHWEVPDSFVDDVLGFIEDNDERR